MQRGIACSQVQKWCCTRKFLDGVLSNTNRNADVVDKFSVRVGVTEEFLFLVTKLSPYFDR